MPDSSGFRIETPAADTREGWRDVLLRAADYIEVHGWARGMKGCGPAGERCMSQAMKATVGELDPDDASIWHNQTHPVTIAYRKLQKFLQADPPTWNDTPGRTAAEVCAALRSCATQ